MTVLKILTVLLIAVLCLYGGSAVAQSPTTEWVNFYSTNTTLQGNPIPLGAIVDAYDPQNVLCGRYTVVEVGSYGFLACYFDDPNTEQDEGIQPGDKVRFEINGRSAGTFRLPAGVENGDRFVVNLPISNGSDNNKSGPVSIPEPMSIILLGSGLAGLAGYVMKHRRHDA